MPYVVSKLSFQLLEIKNMLFQFSDEIHYARVSSDENLLKKIQKPGNDINITGASIINVKQYNKAKFIQQNTPTLENTNKLGTPLQMQKVRKCEASVKACRTCSDEGQRDRQKQLLASASECEMVNFRAQISLSPPHFYLRSQLYRENKPIIIEMSKIKTVLH